VALTAIVRVDTATLTRTLTNLRRRCRSDHKTKTRRDAPHTIKAGRLKAKNRRAAADVQG